VNVDLIVIIRYHYEVGKLEIAFSTEELGSDTVESMVEENFLGFI